ncbi:MAG: hypothetical protein O7161_03815 [Wolbachia endosymbiont of Halictus tumulorum]|nr:hypothetical protein [Wolbachia endosymbiont of Halictus tumulorum]
MRLKMCGSNFYTLTAHPTHLQSGSQTGMTRKGYSDRKYWNDTI